MAMTAQGSSRAVPYINVTPLIDVLLVMLIIFMVITPLKPSRFMADIPAQRDPNENIQNLKPNPLTLVVSVSSATDLKLKLNNHDNPLPEEPCNGVVPDYGSVNDPSHLAQCLHETFARRFSPPAFKSGYETRTDLPMEQRIEKTVFVKAPRTMKYGDVVKVIDAIKGAGANPVGLQVDDLPN
ncbi:MAG TPA: biopolymer transporter ExbD [Pyrinomonadaceae bacterium]|nr:biopolymer transporter ExbD [Pyrinomonadaceae bacterium]